MTERMQNADIAKRIVAFVLDSMVLNTILSIVGLPVYCLLVLISIALDSSNSGSTVAPVVWLVFCLLICVFLLASLLVSYAYFVWLPVKKWNGATIGKRVMGMRVVKTNGQSVTQTDLFLREFIGKFISGLVFYLGYIFIFFDEKGQGWHDKIANTWVVEAEAK